MNKDQDSQTNHIISSSSLSSVSYNEELFKSLYSREFSGFYRSDLEGIPVCSTLFFIISSIFLDRNSLTMGILMMKVSTIITIIVVVSICWLCFASLIIYSLSVDLSSSTDSSYTSTPNLGSITKFLSSYFFGDLISAYKYFIISFFES